MNENPQQHIFTVSELNRTARQLLETNLSTLWIEGEISNFACPSSGHWYFSLKDKTAQVRCAMFKGYNRHLKFHPEEGMHVIARAKVSLYEGRGDFQLIVEFLEEVGFGALQRAFEQLKTKLENEGLFQAIYKKPIPEFPKQIGVITSSTGAAIRDILNVLKRRAPFIPVIIYPTLVQGEQAAEQICDMLQLANERQECDLLILTRGGGSLEDLWPFNEEIVARAIFNSKIPIITGIGHEVDFTISDFVADQRAPTPSAAAELASPNQAELYQQTEQYRQRFIYLILNLFKQTQTKLTWLKKRLQQCHPAQQLQHQIQQLDHLEQRLHSSIRRIIKSKKTTLQSLARTLNSISPLATLERGYAITTDTKNKVITQIKQVKKGDIITTKLAKGKIESTVLTTQKED